VIVGFPPPAKELRPDFPDNAEVNGLDAAAKPPKPEAAPRPDDPRDANDDFTSVLVEFVDVAAAGAGFRLEPKAPNGLLDPVEEPTAPNGDADDWTNLLNNEASKAFCDDSIGFFGDLFPDRDANGDAAVMLPNALPTGSLGEC
jgi:hypothetical protein